MTLGKYKRLRRATVQFIHSVVLNSLRPHGLQHVRLPCPSPTFWSLLKLMSIEAVIPSNHLILCCPLLFLLSIFPASGSFSRSQFFASLARVLEFSFSISSSNEYSGLISFRMDWLDLLAVQGTFKSLLPYNSSKASVFLR